MTMSCLLILIGSLASLVSTQPMSLNEPLQPHLSCNFLTCTGAILGKLSIRTNFVYFIFAFLRGS